MQKTQVRIAVAVAATLFALAARAAETKEPFGMLTIEQVDKLVGQPNVVLVDANHDDVYRKNHLPGAIFMKGSLAQLLPPDKGRTLVFYCASPT
jgi:hypothetical protein